MQVHPACQRLAKNHLIEDHAVKQQQDLNSFDDLGDNFGEQNHQAQVKADQCHQCIHNFAAMEAIKSREEVQVRDKKSQEKFLEIKGKHKRGLYKGTEARQAAKRQRQLDG
jgi:methionyl-tRNA synthetase